MRLLKTMLGYIAIFGFVGVLIFSWREKRADALAREKLGGIVAMSNDSVELDLRNGTRPRKLLRSLGEARRIVILEEEEHVHHGRGATLERDDENIYFFINGPSGNLSDNFLAKRDSLKALAECPDATRPDSTARILRTHYRRSVDVVFHLAASSDNVSLNMSPREYREDTWWPGEIWKIRGASFTRGFMLALHALVCAEPAVN